MAENSAVVGGLTFVNKGLVGVRPPDATSLPTMKGKGAIHDHRWMFTILGAYKRRWAPCVQAHGPGQGQLPLDRVWPQGLWFLSRGADRMAIYKVVCADAPVATEGRPYLIEIN